MDSSISETLSKFGSGLFLLVQVLILLDFTHSWNDAWVEKDERKWLVQSNPLSTPFAAFLLFCRHFDVSVGLSLIY